MQVEKHSKTGFTLAEVMIAMSIAMFLLATTYAALFSMSKGSESMINFSEMNGQSRYALELFGRDMRMAKDVFTDSTHGFSSSEVWITRRADPSTSTDIRVGYEFDDNSRTFTRLVEDSSGNLLSEQILLYDVNSLHLNYFRYINNQTALNPLETKHVQLEAELQRKVLALKNTNWIISARFVMRNKDVTQ